MMHTVKHIHLGNLRCVPTLACLNPNGCTNANETTNGVMSFKGRVLVVTTSNQLTVITEKRIPLKSEGNG